jgi:chemosensory pili system protein ChpA (sensor histidine kinase/response regulator)
MTSVSLVPEVAACIDSLVAGAHAEVNSRALSEIQRLSRALHGGVPESLDAAFAAEQLAGAILQGDMACDDEAIQMFQEALRELQTALAPPPTPTNGSLAAKPSYSAIPADLVEGFIEEGRELLDRAWRHLENRNMREVRRAVHTLKGSSAMVGMRGISALAHAMEDLLDAIHDGDAKHDQETQDRFTRTLDAMAEALPAPGGHTPSIDAMLADYGKSLPLAPAPPQTSAVRPQQPPVSAPAPASPSAEPAAATGKHVRVNLEDLDSSLRSIGELGIVRSGWDQQLAANRRQLDELSLAIRRCQRIAQRLDYEFAVYSPASSSAPWAPTFGNDREEFDALEMDRYTEFHLLSRDLLETASDLMALEAQLSTVATEFDSIRARHVKTCAELQDQILHMRTARASTLIPRLERAVQSAASALGKRVDLTFEGGDTELDKGVLEALTAPLEHLLRNAVSHGIEEADARDRAGKPQSGKILVTVTRDGSNAIFQVRDDGAGIDDSLVRLTIVRNGLAPEPAAASMQGKTLYAFLFEPGFSTASMVSHVSGRGVGLDIVQSAVESLKGSVTVDSVPGQGTAFTLRLPVAQSILRVLFVEAAGETFAIPLANVLRAGRRRDRRQRTAAPSHH